MPHFSRLTDIITCSLTEILNAATNPTGTLQEIIGEMHEGLDACRRNVQTSSTIGERLKREIMDSETQIDVWKDRARQSLADGDDAAARNSLSRKVEIEDLIAGLRPELDAAVSAAQHMFRIQKAARIALCRGSAKTGKTHWAAACHFAGIRNRRSFRHRCDSKTQLCR